MKKNPIDNLRPYKKGQSGNPGGVPKAAGRIKAFRELTYQQFIDSLQRFGNFSPAEIEKELKRPDITMFEMMFARIVKEAAEGKEASRELLINRLWGKVKEEIDFNVRLKAMSEAELIEAGKAAIRVLEGEAVPQLEGEKKNE